VPDSAAGRLYRGEPLEVRRADQRDRLIVAARDVFATSGFHAASIEEIVAAAHVSRTAFYRCFANKDECLLAVLAEGSGRLAEALGAVAASDLDPEEKVTGGVHALVRTLAEDPLMAKVILIEAVGATPDVDRARLDVRAGFAALLEQQMKRFPGWRTRPAAEVRLVALATIAAIAETVSHLVATDGLTAWQEAARYLGAYALRSLTPPPA
jgi:AcrR family transcriptional regulator